MARGLRGLACMLALAVAGCGNPPDKEMQQAQMVIAPAIKTEGKIFQLAQRT